MKTLEFDFVEWKNSTKDLGREPTAAEHRKFFKGPAYPMAFPLIGEPKAWFWVLHGRAVLWGGEEIEFKWQCGVPMTFNTFLLSHAHEWATMMASESKEAPLSIQCCAGIL